MSATAFVDAVAQVSERGADRIRGGHPWVFQSNVTKSPTVEAGIVRVRAANGAPLGWALWSPRSEIRLRMIGRDDSVIPNAEWWFNKIKAAYDRRSSIGADTNGYRVVFGEGDGLPSLVADRYDNTVVVQLLSAGVDAWRDEIADAIRAVTGCTGILARNDPASRQKEGLAREVVLLYGEVPDTVEYLENGLRFLAAPWDGQKTGAFLDQRDNRKLIGDLARGETLDCFSYHGSFALHMARNANHVTAVDMSVPALARIADHSSLNGVSNISAIQGDVFDVLRTWYKEGRRFDTIVVDPPAFAKNKLALDRARRGYRDINLHAMKLLAPGGSMLTASCSFHLSRAAFSDVLNAAARDSARVIALRANMVQPVDHPELLSVPETGYLKASLLEALD